MVPNGLTAVRKKSCGLSLWSARQKQQGGWVEVAGIGPDGMEALDE